LSSELRICALAVATVAACAHRPPAPAGPTVFAESAAFAAVSGRAHRILKRDVNGDGVEDAVVALRSDRGWAPAVFAHAVDEDGRHSWRAACEGPAVPGSELGELAWVEMNDGPLLLLVGAEETPDELIQSLVLVDPADHCALRLEERLLLAKPGHQVIAPNSVPAGVRLEAGVLAISDRPATVRLEGPEGVAAVLTGVRVRRVGGSREVVEVEEANANLLVPRSIVVSWRGPGEAMELSMLTDGSDRTSFVARPDHAGALRIEANSTVALVLLHHGCGEASGDETLRLRIADEPPWSSGAPVPSGSFVRAAGRTISAGGVRRDLLALREPAAEIVMQLGRAESNRCLRQVRAFGFRGEPTH
jgi:hypothetical protein